MQKRVTVCSTLSRGGHCTQHHQKLSGWRLMDMRPGKRSALIPAAGVTTSFEFTSP